MKKSVTQFDLSAAFKALDEMEYPKVEGGIRPNRVDLKENFGSRKLRTDILVEDYYDVNDNNDLEAAAEEREGEVAKAKLARIEKIVDLDAESEDDLLTSYEGKVIIQCPQCMTLFYKDEKDLEVDENNPDVVNINETCQHCGNTSGYMVIGKVAPVEKAELDNFDTEDFEEEPVEETEEEVVEEEPTEEEDLEDVDALNLDFDEEEPAEEEANESLNKAAIQKEVDKKHCADNDSKNLTLNENLNDDDKIVFKNPVIVNLPNDNVGTIEVEAGDEELAWLVNKLATERYEAEDAAMAGFEYFDEIAEEKGLRYNQIFEDEFEEGLKEDKGEAAAQDELQAEHEAPIEEAKKVCEKCGKEICECDKQELKESEVEDIIKSVVNSWDLGEACEGKECEKPLNEEGNAAWNELSNEPRDRYHVINNACKAAKEAGEACPFAGGKWILYGVDKAYDPVETKELPAATKPAEVKRVRDELLNNNENIIGVYVSRMYKEIATNKAEEVEIYTYMKFKPGFEDDGVEESLKECKGKDCSAEEAIKKILMKESLNEGLTAYIDLSGSLADKEDELTAKAKEAGATDIIKFDSSTFDEVIEGAQDKKVLLVTNNDDYKNNTDLIGNKNVKIIMLDESLNKAEVQKDVDKKHCAENDSENLTLNEAADEEAIEDEVAEEEIPAETEDIADEVADEETAEEAEENTDEEALNEQPVETTIGEIKEVAEEVAEKVAEPVEDEEAAEEQAEEIKEIVNEVVEDKFAEEADDLENEEATEEEVPAEEEAADETEVVEEPVEEVEEALTEDNNEALSDKEFADLLASKEAQEAIFDENLRECDLQEVLDNIDDIDEESFEEAFTKALTDVYENVNNYKLKECTVKNGKLVVEGLINFKSNASRNATCTFDKAQIRKLTNELVLEGYSKDFAKQSNFKVSCNVEDNGKNLFVENLNYSYKIGENLVEGYTRK